MPRLRFDFPALDDDASRAPSAPVIFEDPVGVIEAGALDEVIPAIEAVQAAVDSGLHAAGYVRYEAAPAFDAAMGVRPGGALPLVWFGLFARPSRPVETRRDASSPVEAAEGAEGIPTLDWDIEMSREEHASAVAAIREAIAEGRTYQVNLTTRLRASYDGDPEALYQRLRRTQGSGWHALLDLGRHVIISASPELFFRVSGRGITTRPMKGTRPRGRWPEEDRALAEALASSPKDRAENLMIVDLLRNDVGRVSVPGGVRVPRLLDVERYRTVWQMTSTVTGRLRDDVALPDLFRALFPCGSVTGAPKISTMRMIAALETSPREVYCGAIGWVRPGGDCAFSVPIRTAWLDREAGRLTYGTGGGVVWDSTAEAEYDELLAKAAVARGPWPSFRLLETLALDGGAPVRLDRHLRRMAASADRFDFPFPEGDVRAAVDRAAADAPAGRVRLRVTLGADGDVETELGPLDVVGDDGPDDGGLPVVALAGAPIDARNPFLYHKTTHRAVYDRHLAEAAADVFDVLLWNEAGEVTEFSRGNVVAEIGGRLVTPPREAGLLPGCLRGELIEGGRVVEETLTVDDIRRAARVWLINSARGWVRVRAADQRT